MNLSRWLLTLVAVSCAACSSVTPQHNGRTGLFARLGMLHPANEGDGDRGPASYSAREDDGHPGAVEVAPQGDEESAEEIADIGGISLRWPLKAVRVTSEFGKRGKEFHEGIDLQAKTGTSVYAAQAGKVIYAGRKIKGYGNLVVIRHEKGVATVYAHNSKLLVKLGDRVKIGQKIAISGKSGRVSGPHLHFEVRKGVSAVDPMKVMPSPGTLKASL